MIHPVVPLDAPLTDEIAANMTLREPNRKALVRLAETLQAAAGEPFEVICDIATAVGKTYLAGGLIDYLSQSGVRNVLIVTPGRTILQKTVDNFTEGHPKSILGGMETRPLVITSENFNTGAIGAALHDESVTKLYVFSVQSLIRPTDNMTRRTRKLQEWLGEDLYEFMRTQDDLVIIADEYHVYSAPAFSRAVRELDAMALIGLTATPAQADEGKVIYRYPLAYAIADKLVKTPILVGRRDGAIDVETRLRDGLLLLDAKQKAADEWAGIHNEPHVNAVMFVVADTIDNANAVAEILQKPGLLAENYENSVLVVHSEVPDDDLAKLATVEDVESKVRVIISVSMLKEGWDVKNIFVICSLRPSISLVLTEQTLGRGLRLPWGEYTGVELLDSVEVISHESYAQLLARANVLLEGLVESRTELALRPIGTETVVVSTAPESLGIATDSPRPVDNEDEVEIPTGTPGFVVTTFEERREEAGQQVEAVAVPVEPLRYDVHIPKVTRTVIGQNFELSSVPDDEFVELGRRLASAGGTALARKRLEVVEDVNGGYKVIPIEAEDTIDASRPMLALGDAVRQLRDGITRLDFFAESRQSLAAADRMANAVVTGAGDENALASYLGAAVNGARLILMRNYKRAPELVETSVEDSVFVPIRSNSRPIELNRYADYKLRTAYGNWERSLYPINWFDSKTERTFANKIDEDHNVLLWSRILRGELIIQWDGGRYTPDFYVETEEMNFLIETKADRDIDTPVVQGKKAAAERWARYVGDEGFGRWRYLLVAEEVLKVARSMAAVVQQAG